MLLNTFKGYGIQSLVIAALLSVAGPAWSACTIEGKVARLRSAVGGVAIVDIAPLVPFPTVYTFFTVPSDRYMALLGDAQAGNLTVIVSGNAATCPAPVRGFVNGGVLTSGDVYSNR